MGVERAFSKMGCKGDLGISAAIPHLLLLLAPGQGLPGPRHIAEKGSSGSPDDHAAQACIDGIATCCSRL